MTVYKIAITGGPGAGKSTVLQKVERHFGDSIIVMPEVASLLYNNGYPRAEEGISPADRKKWRDSFQEAVFFLQRNMEDECVRRAQRQKIKVIVYDRGILDGAVYYLNSLEKFIERFGMGVQEAYARYDLIVHFESLAVKNPKQYELLIKTNPARFEKAFQAVKSDEMVRKIWSKHSNWIEVSSTLGIDGLADYAISLIDSKLKEKF